MEKKLTHSKWFLYLTEFFAGMSVMAVELGASRLMAPYFSSSQIVWTVIIGVIMVAMAVGNIWGGRMADKSKSPDRLYGRVIIAAIWIALIPFAGRWMIAGISFLLALFASVVVQKNIRDIHLFSNKPSAPDEKLKSAGEQRSEKNAS